MIINSLPKEGTQYPDIQVLNQTTVSTTSMYYNAASILGCQTTIIINIPLNSTFGPVIKFKVIATNASTFSIVSTTPLFTNQTFGAYKIDGKTFELGSFSISLNGIYANNKTEKITPIALTCDDAPALSDLGIILPSEPIPISRYGEYLFEVPVKVPSLAESNSIELSFALALGSSPFKVFYEQISTNFFILRFKLSDPSLITFQDLIEITPQNLNSYINPTNYTSFKIYPNVNVSSENQFSNINFYPDYNGETTPEYFGYVIFDILNDDRAIVPGVTNNLLNLDTSEMLDFSVAFPVGYNGTHSQFMGIIQPGRKASFTWYLASTDNQDIADTRFSPKRNTMVTPTSTTVQALTNCRIALIGIGAESFEYTMPTTYKFSTNNGDFHEYIPYWSVDSFYTITNITSMSHEMILPKDYYDPSFPMYASILNYDDTVNIQVPQPLIAPTDGRTPPTVQDLELISPTGLLSGFYILRFKVLSNVSKFHHLDINGKKVYAINIVSGGMDENSIGYYEITVNYTFVKSMSNSYTITSCGIFLNCETKYYFPQLLNPFPSLQLPQNNLVTVYDISYINFKYNNLNTTESQKNNIIYLKINGLSGSSDAETIQFKLDILNSYLPFSWNSSVSMFQCNFKIPGNYYSGSVGYSVILGGNTYSYPSVFIATGSNSTLSVTSLKSDMLPPLISYIEAYPSINVYLDPYNSTLNIFGWDLEIEEGVNGFDHGEVNITSVYDKVGFTFKFNSSDLIDGYIIQIRINHTEMVCFDQGYSITSVYLVDKQGYETSRSSQYESVSALFKVAASDQLFIYVQCSDDNNSEYNSTNPDTTVPFISSFILESGFNQIAVDFGSSASNKTVIATLVIEDSESGLSSRHHPTIYLQDVFGTLMAISNGNGMTVIGDTGYSRTYSCVITIPFGFGYPAGASIAIYGLVDKFMNTRGYTHYSLLYDIGGGGNPLSPYISTTYTLAPSIVNMVPTFESDYKSAQFIIYGSFLGLVSSDIRLTVDYISESHSSEETQLPVNTITIRSLLSTTTESVPFTISSIFGNYIAISVDLQNAISRQIQIQLSVGGQPSNAYNFLLPSEVIDPTSTSGTSSISTTSTITPQTTTGGSVTSATGTSTDGSTGTTPTTTTTTATTSTTTTTSGTTTSSTTTSTTGTSGPDCSKLSNCGGPSQGNCVADNTCSCINSWIGSDCTSKPLEGVTINVNPNSPSASLNQDDGSGFKLSSLINLYQIREINSVTNKILYQYDLQDKWVPVKQSSPKPNTFIYSNTLPNAKTSIIYATIAIYEQQSTFEFAGEQYSINPNSIKFTINITNYKVDNVLNNLELIMQAQLNSSQTDDICSKKEIVKGSISDQLSVQLNNKSLYCRFLNSALLDGTTAVNNLTHVNLNSEFQALVKPNSGQYYYGIVLPTFNDYLILDPDFSLLLQSSTISNDDEGICSSSSSKKFPTGAIVGIVVGGVAFVVVIGIVVSTLLFRRHRFSSVTMKLRSWNSKRRSKSKSYNLKNF
ncbi:hypothetical protein ACTA71_000657 [Dictyostelium dimigraforme]